MMDIHLSSEDAELLEPDHLHRVTQRSLRIITNWLRSESARRLGKELRIQTKAVRDRIRVNHQGDGSNLWVGLLPLSIHRLGSPKQTPTGVDVNGRFFKGAFINPMSSSELLVFKRSRESRLPIELVTEDYSDEMEKEIIDLTGELNTKWQEVFANELYK